MKQIGVIGLGQFGSHLALSLTDLGCQVVAVDRSEARVELVRDQVDRAVILDARDYEALTSVLSADIDEVVVSLGESMEASVLCTLHLKKIGITRIRAKAINEDHAAILRAVGADRVVFPEMEIAHRVAMHIVNPNLLDFIPLAPGYQVAEVASPEPFHGKSLIELDLRKRFEVLIIAVKKKSRKAFVFLPGPEYVIEPGDVMTAIGTEAVLQQMAKGKT